MAVVGRKAPLWYNLIAIVLFVGLLAVGARGAPSAPKFVASWAGQFNYAEGVAVDHKGNVLVADAWNHRIVKFDPSGKQLLAFGTQGDKDGQFLAPHAVTVDKHDNIYVADTWNHRIQKFSPEGKFLLKFGALAAPFFGVYPTGPAGLFNYPTGIAVDSKGNIYVSEYNANRGQMFNAKGVFLLFWGTGGRQDDQFQNPSGICVDNQDLVYVVDSNNARVQKFEFKDIIPPPAAVEAETLKFEAKNGKAEVSKKTLTPAWGGGAAIVLKPRSVPATLTLKLKVADTGTYEIFISLDKGPKQGQVSLKIDGKGQGRRFDGWASDRSVEKASFGQVDLKKGEHGLELEVTGKNKQAKGTELAVDVVSLVSQTKERFLGKWGREGKEEGQMLRPRGICFDGKDALCIADTGNHRILRYSLSGRLLSAWGRQGSKPGEFDTPFDVAAANGSVYVVDWRNNRVEKFSF